MFLFTLLFLDIHPPTSSIHTHTTSITLIISIHLNHNDLQNAI